MTIRVNIHDPYCRGGKSANGLSAFYDITLKFESASVTEQSEYSFNYGNAIS